MTSIHKEVKRPDQIEVSLLTFFNYLKGHSSKIVALLVAFLCILAGVLTYQSMAQKKNLKLSEELYSIKRDVKANPADVSKLSETISKLQGLKNKAKSGIIAFETSLLLGDLHSKKGDLAAATTELESAVKLAPAKELKALASYSLAYSFENQKKWDQAIETLQSALKDKDSNLRSELLFNLARVQEQKGETDRAKETYSQIITEFANTPVGKKAEQYKASLLGEMRK